MTANEPDNLKKISDVTAPELTVPSTTSRSVIIGHGPIMKDPMMTNDADPNDEQTKSPNTTNQTNEPTLQHTNQPTKSVMLRGVLRRDHETVSASVVVEEPKPTEPPRGNSADTAPSGTDADGDGMLQPTVVPDQVAKAAPEATIIQDVRPNEPVSELTDEELETKAVQATKDAKKTEEVDDLRQAELETLISSGSFHVQISASKKQRQSKLWLTISVSIAVIVAAAIIVGIFSSTIAYKNGSIHFCLGVTNETQCS